MSSPLRSDSWAAPQVREVFSASRDHFVRVTPGTAVGDTVGFAGAEKGKYATAEFYRRVKPIVEEAFAPRTTLHGSLADVFGVGLFFTGQSGIGKSECVLDLVERGHRLVADDLVICKRRGTDVLIGRGHELQRHHMEIRGVGLVDVPAIFGIRAVRQQKRFEVVVQLEPWYQECVEWHGLGGRCAGIRCLGGTFQSITTVQEEREELMRRKADLDSLYASIQERSDQFDAMMIELEGLNEVSADLQRGLNIGGEASVEEAG